MKSHTSRSLARQLPLALALAAGALAAQAGPVKPPPLPPGTDMVRVAPGLTPEEVSRQKRAHKHSKLEKKDFTRDDTLDADGGKTPKPPKAK